MEDNLRITTNKGVYVLRFSLRRLEMIEQALRKSVMAVIQSGAPTLKEVEIMCAYALIREDAVEYEDTKKAIQIIHEVLSGPGAYVKLLEMIGEAVQRDCPFLFPAG